MFDSLLMDSYVSSTTGVRPLHVLQASREVLASTEQKLSSSYHLVALTREEAMAPHSGTLAWKIHMDGGAW